MKYFNISQNRLNRKLRKCEKKDHKWSYHKSTLKSTTNVRICERCGMVQIYQNEECYEWLNPGWYDMIRRTREGAIEWEAKKRQEQINKQG